MDSLKTGNATTAAAAAAAGVVFTCYGTGTDAAGQRAGMDGGVRGSLARRWNPHMYAGRASRR